jgi:hypothetical protein
MRQVEVVGVRIAVKTSDVLKVDGWWGSLFYGE